MNPDPKQRLPREILEELMEEGAEAFRSVLEKLVNLAMELESSELLGADPYVRTSRRPIGQGAVRTPLVVPPAPSLGQPPSPPTTYRRLLRSAVSFPVKWTI